jgi:hypothetical protein
MLRKFGIIAVLSLIVAALAAVPALAANPHEVGNNPIVCEEVQVQGGPAVRCSGSIAGLGSADRVTISPSTPDSRARRGLARISRAATSRPRASRLRLRVAESTSP